jgi:LemA protein
MNTIWIVGGALFLFALWMFDVDGRWIVACGAALLAWSFNSLVSAKNQVDTAFGSVDAMLQKRHDLIPNLVATVERYAEHESQVLDDVTRLRAAATSGQLPTPQLAEVESHLGRAVAQLVATAESYPELKASENFQQLQRALNEAEEQISAARRAYNATVKQYNDGVQMFPTNVLARLAGYAPRAYFELPSENRARPDVAAQFRASARP